MRSVTPLLTIAIGFLLNADFVRSQDVVKPVEKDKRVQANGKAWRLEKATITDPTRPRVLLIGDSILNGYLPKTVKELTGKAFVDAWVNPYCQSENFNKLLAEVLENGPYAVVHINMGLHGWLPGRIKEGTFVPLTKGFIEVIRNKCPDAKIIWASSTPVRTKGKSDELDPAINPNIVEQNRMAAEVMNEMHVPIDDFYSLLIDKLPLGLPDGFHWSQPAYQILAEACAQMVLKELPSKK